MFYTIRSVHNAELIKTLSAEEFAASREIRRAADADANKVFMQEGLEAGNDRMHEAISQLRQARDARRCDSQFVRDEFIRATRKFVQIECVTDLLADFVNKK